ncbi:hypothetical protein Gohar_002717, partial [Gossypium harknessii]|nr:hypothetical protein [Gossypium harknessii]
MIFLEIGAVLSSIGFYEAQLTSCAYQLLGMADLGVLPQCFSVRSKWFNTPWLGILVSTLITVAVSSMNFADLISSINFLYSLAMLLEFASFLWLRRKLPMMERPFRVPLELPGLTMMCLIPSGFLVYIMSLANGTVLLLGMEESGGDDREGRDEISVLAEELIQLSVKGSMVNLFLIMFDWKEDLETIMEGRPWLFHKSIILFDRLIQPIERGQIRLTSSPFWINIGSCLPEFDKKDLLHAIGVMFGGVLRYEISGDSCRL